MAGVSHLPLLERKTCMWVTVARFCPFMLLLLSNVICCPNAVGITFSQAVLSILGGDVFPSLPRLPLIIPPSSVGVTATRLSRESQGFFKESERHRGVQNK